MSTGAQLALLLAAGLWAGAQNALAGGGSFVTLPALMLTGLTPLAANITSTVALFPSYLISGWAGRQLVSGVATLGFRTLLAISAVGGAGGGLLLLVTPAALFARLVPWLVLFATLVFAWGSRARPAGRAPRLGTGQLALAQFGIAVYGGYFGGGIGFLMLAALSLAGLSVRHAGATKNALSGVLNAAAVLLFVRSPHVHWLPAAVLGLGALAGGWLGALALHRVNEKLLRGAVIGLGAALTVGLFLKPF